MLNETMARPGKRPATQDEIEYAVSMLGYLGESSKAHLASEALASGMTAYQPVVISDFHQLADELILLVPPGTYALPKSVLETPRCFIGMPQLKMPPVFVTGVPLRTKVFPTLLLVEGEHREVTNFDTGEASDLMFYPAALSKFACLNLDTQFPSILETALDGAQMFSNSLFDVTCSERVDVYNVVCDTYMFGRDWVREAYGESGCRSRDVVERGLDGLQQGGLKVIDAVFNPLIALGGKLDRLFGNR